MKMSGFWSVLLVTSAILMFTAKGKSNYDMLRKGEKKYVDMVIRYANENFTFGNKQLNKEHLNFERRLGEAVITEQEVKMNLILKATVCSKATKGSEHKHHSDCKFIEKNRPYINCVYCKMDTNPDHHIDCIRHKDVEKKNAIRSEKYWMSWMSLITKREDKTYCEQI
ncbi:hypothetical protein UPYG_G00301270 [Umbra pygmaea]|uniref:Uncharacterized protein n=1 Tax=Umbra pygmaea TaxID=75934 RepID=A0ABD0WT85_UMBPY